MNSKTNAQYVGLGIVIAAMTAVTFFAVAPASASAAYVDIKANGQDGINHFVTVNPNDTVVISWTSSGATYCNTGNSPGGIYSNNPPSWQAYVPKPTSGSETFIATTSPMGWGIQCFGGTAGTTGVQDWVDIQFGVNSANITCSANSQCGTDGFVGGQFCQGNNVYQNFTTFTCNNPGTGNSFCSNNTSIQLKQTCSGNQVCNNGSCISVVCNQNSDCGNSAPIGSPYCQGNSIYTNFLTFTCNNPGTANAFCSSNVLPLIQQTCAANQTCNNGSCTIPINITCSTNSQCGTDGFVSGPFCQGNSIYKNYTTFTCNNPGTQNSFCSNNTAAQLQSTCTANQTCSNGTCNNIQSACSQNADCGTNGIIGSPFCQGNSVYQNAITFTCNNPGTANAFCSNSISAQVQTNCGANQVCANGTCNNINITCSTNSQCGTDGLVGSNFCQGNAVYRNFTSYTCNNPGTANSYCSNSTAAQLQSTCTANQTCSNGACNNIQSACSQNADCGTNGLIGSPFCQGNSVYQNSITYTCNNPGTANAFCSNSTTAQVQTNCGTNQICTNGTCNNLNITCSANSQCGTDGFVGGQFCQGNSVYRNYTTYTCNNPGTANSYCSNNTQAQVQTNCTANQTCSNGTCNNINITCSTNSQCGTDGFVGSPFCQGNGVFQNFTSHTCVNPGTQYSFCIDSTQAQQQQVCTEGQQCTNGSCSQQNNNNFARRGPGFWQTHTAFTTATFNSAPLFVGFNGPVGPGTHKGLLTTPGQVFGAFYASIPKTTFNAMRSDVDRERMILLPHLLTAKLNCAAFGCSPAEQNAIMVADTAYMSNNMILMDNYVSILNNSNGGNNGNINNSGSATPGVSQAIADEAFWDMP